MDECLGREGVTGGEGERSGRINDGCWRSSCKTKV